MAERFFAEHAKLRCIVKKAALDSLLLVTGRGCDFSGCPVAVVVLPGALVLWIGRRIHLYGTMVCPSGTRELLLVHTLVL
jgi:hypothetical protein